ncbi:unnamed protein product [Trichogramma brassicae]|uniref:Reverse transcriptase zinc-binding domain-containing protein n=1 Tax=Trichogramma brassicae TaxID=86971 RepID=A0A6H5IM20_9HYME|nr:unnamed protein product [Trichogramma brassicae]
MSYHLTQLLTGHGYFRHHSQRYDNNASARCPVCPDETENVEHVFFHCSRFEPEREVLQAQIGERTEPENIVRLMLRDRSNWNAVSNFAKTNSYDRYERCYVETWDVEDGKEVPICKSCLRPVDTPAQYMYGALHMSPPLQTPWRKTSFVNSVLLEQYYQIEFEFDLTVRSHKEDWTTPSGQLVPMCPLCDRPVDTPGLLLWEMLMATFM